MQRHNSLEAQNARQLLIISVQKIAMETVAPVCSCKVLEEKDCKEMDLEKPGETNWLLRWRPLPQMRKQWVPKRQPAMNIFEPGYPGNHPLWSISGLQNSAFIIFPILWVKAG